MYLYEISTLGPIRGDAVAFQLMPASHIFVMRTGEMLGGLATTSNPLQTCDGPVTTAISHRRQRKNVFISFFHDTAARTCVASQRNRNPLSFYTQIRKLLSNYCPCAYFCSQIIYVDRIFICNKDKKKAGHDKQTMLSRASATGKSRVPKRHPEGCLW